MTKSIVLFATVSLFLVACQNSPKTQNNLKTENSKVKTEVKLTDIAFNLAKNYFVKNTVVTLSNPKIETTEKFNEIFGMATTMGKDGKPTEIDFAKQYVVAIILPETDLATTISIINLQKNESEEIILKYKTEVGPKQSYRTVPNIAIIIDKTENGNLTLEEVK